MKKRKRWNIKQRLQTMIMGMGIVALLLGLFSFPEESHAFRLTNGKGNDGYFLSITLDTPNGRVVPVTVYDNHPKAQSAKKFVEATSGGHMLYNRLEVEGPRNGKFKTLGLVDKDAGKGERTSWNNKMKKSLGGYSGLNVSTSIASDTLIEMNQDDLLGWTFPAFAGRDEAENYIASQRDLDRALWVSETMVNDFNRFLSFYRNAVEQYGSDSGKKKIKNLSDADFANMIISFSNAAREAQANGKKVTVQGTNYGVNVEFRRASGNAVKTSGELSQNNYVMAKLVKGKNGKSITQTIEQPFIENVPKGYRKGQPLYNGLTGKLKKAVEGTDSHKKKDIKYLTWQHIALQAVSNWTSGKNISFANVTDITKPNVAEQWLGETTSSLLANLREFLGLHSSSDLILNQGNRASDTYYKGIMPNLWMTSASALHWLSYALAWMLIIGAVAKLLIQRNFAAINPSERVDMLNGIKNLMIVGFALSIYDVAFAGLTEFNFLIVDALSNLGVGVESFGKSPMNANSGLLASSLVGVVYFCFDIYFNFYYISRALIIAILYAVGPLYVAAIAFGEKYRQIFSSYAKELIGNVFVQSFHATLVVFFAGISIYGGLRTIETMVLLFCFIPLTRFFKESVGASGGITDALTGNALGAGAGMAAGLIGSQFSKGKNGGKTKSSNSSVENDMNFNTKSGSSFVGATEEGKNKSMIHHGVSGAKVGLNAAAGATKAVVGAGLVAGGAATGMRGVSQLGGYMVGRGMDQVVDAGKTTVSSGVNMVKSALGGPKLVEGLPEEKTGSPAPESVHDMKDGTYMYTFDKTSFASGTGIASMREIDGFENEASISTNYIYKKNNAEGQGFVGNSSHLNGSTYARRIHAAAEAFQSGDQKRIQAYQEQGLMDARVDRSTGKVSFVVDRDKVGLGQFAKSGDKLYVQRNTPNSSNPLDAIFDKEPPSVTKNSSTYNDLSKQMWNK